MLSHLKTGYVHIVTTERILIFMIMSTRVV